MNKFLYIFLLYGVWVILVEGFTIVSLITGLVVCFVCIFLYNKFLPSPLSRKFKTINIFLLIIYPFYLIGQIYVSAFNSIRLIIAGANVDVVKVKTNIKSKILRTVIANSFTLTPGSISLDINNNEITILRLTDKNKTHDDAQKEVENILYRLEKKITIKKRQDV